MLVRSLLSYSDKFALSSCLLFLSVFLFILKYISPTAYGGVALSPACRCNCDVSPGFVFPPRSCPHPGFYPLAA